MSFLTQRIANNFPRWSKARRDPSSMAQRLLTTVAELSEDQQITNKWISEHADPLSYRIGTAHLYSVELDADDQFSISYDSTGQSYYQLHTTVEGTDGSGTRTLTNVETIEDMLYAVPDRLTLWKSESYSTATVYSAGTISTGWPTERLLVEVTGSTDYYPKNRDENLRRSDKHRVVITGKDVNHLHVVEVVEIPVDGIYKTKNWFSEVTKVDSEGFDGTVTVKVPVTPSWIVDPYRVLVSENLEGPLMLQANYDGASTKTHLSLFTTVFKDATEFLSGGYNPVNNFELYGYMLLRDSAGVDIEVVDLDINPETSRLWALGADGRVHIFDHSLPSFGVPTESLETVNTYIEIHPLRHYEKFGKTSPLYTYFRSVRFSVVDVTIRRKAPDGTEHWLDSNDVWQSSASSIPGKEQAKTVADSAPHIKFETTYDQTGQWEYWCTVRTEFDTTTYYTSVMVPEMRAEVSIASGVASPTGCYFSHNGRFAILDGTTARYYDADADLYIADFNGNRLILRSEYTSVEVTP